MHIMKEGVRVTNPKGLPGLHSHDVGLEEAVGIIQKRASRGSGKRLILQTFLNVNEHVGQAPFRGDQIMAGGDLGGWPASGQGVHLDGLFWWRIAREKDVSREFGLGSGCAANHTGGKCTAGCDSW